MMVTNTSDQKSSPWLWVLLLATLMLTLYVSIQSDEVDDGIELIQPAHKARINAKKSKPAKRNPDQANLVSVPEDLIPIDLLQRAQPLQSFGNAFVSRSWYVPPPPPPRQEEEFVPEVPKAPAIPFTYIGKFDEYQLYLQEGEELYTVEVGDIIKGVWRLESDEATRIVMTYLPLNEQKILNKQ